jgi:hypothetical protein
VSRGNRVEEYRQNAQQCEKRAERVIAPGSPRIYCELARQWLDMATQAEKLELDLKRAMEASKRGAGKFSTRVARSKLNLLSSHGISHDCAARA